MVSIQKYFRLRKKIFSFRKHFHFAQKKENQKHFEKNRISFSGCGPCMRATLR